jgi:hypothetical protein
MRSNWNESCFRPSVERTKTTGVAVNTAWMSLATVVTLNQDEVQRAPEDNDHHNGGDQSKSLLLTCSYVSTVSIYHTCDID